MTRLICAGIATADLILGVDALPSRPEKYRAGATDLTTGGCALNAAVAAARLGGDVSLAGRIGADVFGDLILRDLAAEGVDTALLARDPERPTPRSAVMVDARGERMIVNHRDEALFATGFAAGIALPPGAAFDAALADTRWPAGAAALMRAAHARGVPGVIDAEAPVAVASEALALASHIAFSEQGLAGHTGLPDPADALRAAARRHPGAWLCVTRGAAPVLVLSGGALDEIPAFPVEAVDTLGAGDIWHGAFALFLGEGMAESGAVRAANAVAALRTTRFGGRAALPDRAALSAFLKETPP